MPGTERSGRRTIELPEGLNLPSMGHTERSHRRFLEALKQALCNGQVDVRVAEALTSMAKASLASVTAQLKRSENEELEKMLKRAEAVNAAGEAHETADRHHASGRKTDGSDPETP